MHSFFDNLHEDRLAVHPNPGSRTVVSSVEGHEKEARIDIIGRCPSSDDGSQLRQYNILLEQSSPSGSSRI